MVAVTSLQQWKPFTLPKFSGRNNNINKNKKVQIFISWFLHLKWRKIRWQKWRERFLISVKKGREKKNIFTLYRFVSLQRGVSEWVCVSTLSHKNLQNPTVPAPQKNKNKNKFSFLNFYFILLTFCAFPFPFSRDKE